LSGSQHLFCGLDNIDRESERLLDYFGWHRKVEIAD